ncbi:MAG: VTC domain-containing protein [Pirellulaceae bacterium]
MQGRYELKLVVDGATKQRFVDAIRDNVYADPHGDNAVYRVSSLYFDSPDFRAYWEKLDGESLRRKYRLRYYSVDEQSGSVQNGFMEIKHRVHNTVYKQRVALTDQGAEAILADDLELASLDRHALPKQEPGLVEQIQRHATGQPLRAATVITYLREAWMGNVDHRLRITFDSRCQAYQPAAFGQVGNNLGQPILPEHQCIMEIKFDHSIPCWIRDVLVDQQLHLQRFSKYAAGVIQPACSELQQLLNRHRQVRQGPTTTAATPCAQKPLLPIGENAAPVVNPNAIT